MNGAANGSALRIGIVAGESSGDQLGAALIDALRARVPAVQCFGVAGPRMIAAGCEPWASAEELAVMGLTEVMPHLPRLLRLRRELVRRMCAAPPHVFVGVDYKEFNLSVARRLKACGIRTVQYVSPQVWAWRPGRVKTIASAVDLVLCLLPFEAAFYASHGVRAVFVGHPLADEIPLEADRAAARAALQIAPDATLVALLPGSRVGEVERLGAAFADAAAFIARSRAHVQFIAPMATIASRRTFEREAGPLFPAIRVVDGGARQVLAACDVALVASGTATLEAMLSQRPMVVAYKLAAVTAFIARRLGVVKSRFMALPNLLAGRLLVPEFFQENVTAATLGAAVLAELDDPERARTLQAEFRRIHMELRCGGAARAASAILECAGFAA
ncbi:MAG TPA: lipid-A-disaccharide synthase [Steroidobacteraceae bacterium]